MADNQSIDSLLHENRSFKPPEDFAAKAHIPSMEAYRQLCDQADKDPEAFWRERAQALDWIRPFDQVMQWQAPHAKWFLGGQLNVAANCLDRHLEGPRRNKPAIIWEGEPGDRKTLTFGELTLEVCKFANVLKKLGVTTGDRVALYMPMVPELAIAVLACARIGATHNVIFGGFSAEALRERINDSTCTCVITADGGWRRGKVVALKDQVDQACTKTPSVKHVVVVRRTENKVSWQEGRDHWWHEEMQAASDHCEPVPLDSEHPLFILYTSGTTGKPKGIVHTTGGYMVHAAWSSKIVFDLKEDDIYWCTADIGWVTGHTYVLYGVLANGATTLMYEGAPNHPDPGRFWEIVDRHRVTIFYTAPTAIRAFMKWGDAYPKKYALDSLRLLGTVGEPINPEAWIWYHKTIGKNRCPIVDTWWQTETGGIMISPLPGVTSTKPGSATLPLPGISAEIFNEDGQPVPPGKGGLLVLTRPWPSMLRTIHGDAERYERQYWQKFPGVYFAGDGAHVDEDGYFWIMGRIDDVLNVAGHRLGTMEIESALVAHPGVVEAAVVGKPDDIKGQAIVGFVILAEGFSPGTSLEKELCNHVAKEIGAIAKPHTVHFTEALPKTRSGKIMRRLLQEIAEKGTSTGDQTTLEDASVLEKLQG